MATPRCREKLLAALSVKLESIGVSSCGRRQLYQYLRFYQVYPQTVRSVTAQFSALIPAGRRLRGKVRSATAQSGADAQEMLRRLSYTHFEQLVALDDSSVIAFQVTKLGTLPPPVCPSRSRSESVA